MDYPPITDPMYSLLLSEVVSKCLTAESQLRADSVQVFQLAVVLSTHLTDWLFSILAGLTAGCCDDG